MLTCLVLKNLKGLVYQKTHMIFLIVETDDDEYQLRCVTPHGLLYSDTMRSEFDLAETIDSLRDVANQLEKLTSQVH